MSETTPSPKRVVLGAWRLPTESRLVTWLWQVEASALGPGLQPEGSQADILYVITYGLDLFEDHSIIGVYETRAEALRSVGHTPVTD